MSPDDFKESISNGAELYRLGLISQWYDNRFNQLGESYPAMNIELFNEYVLDWMRGIVPFDSKPSITHQGSFDEIMDRQRLANMTKHQFRDILNRVKLQDTNLPDEQIYAEFCASIDAKNSGLINRDNRLN